MFTTEYISLINLAYFIKKMLNYFDNKMIKHIFA